jgi:cobalt-zinc-cadmium resistance protein CzcA
MPPKVISMNEAVKLTLANNPTSKNAELRINFSKSQALSSVELAPTEINYANGQMYFSTNDSYFEIDQHLGSPLTYIQKGKYNKQTVKLSETEQKVIIKKLTAEVKIIYTKCVYYQSKLATIKELSPLYDQILAISGVPYNPMDTNQLNRALAETSFANFQNQLFQAEQDFTLSCHNLQQVMYTPEPYSPADSSLELYAIEILNNGPDKFYPATDLTVYDETIILSQMKIQVEQSKLFPEITVGYFNHSINNNKGFQGFKVGVAIPFWYFPQKEKINEARIDYEIAKNEADFQKFNLTKTIENLKIQLDKLFVQISFYRENALNTADLLIKSVNLDLKNKKLNYLKIYKNMEDALKIRTDYLEKMKLYNQTAIQLESLID